MSNIQPKVPVEKLQELENNYYDLGDNINNSTEPINYDF